MTGQTQDEIDERRLTAYVSIAVHRYAGRWRRSLFERTESERVILNAPVDQGDAAELCDLVPGSLAAEDDYLRAAPLEETLSDPILFRAYQHLTAQQRQVLKDLVVAAELERSVANRMGVTQQSVSCAKRNALYRLRHASSAMGGWRHRD